MNDSVFIVAGASLVAPPCADARERPRARLADPCAGDGLSARDLLRHTRVSALVHEAIGACMDTCGPHLSGSSVVGTVFASVYGCVSATDQTRSSFRKGGVLGIDPMHFAKATHNFPASAASMAYGFRGPGTAFVGRRNAWIDAVGFSSALIREGAADAMVVTAFDEIDERVAAHLSASGYFRDGASAPRNVAECCAAVVLASRTLADRIPAANRWRLGRWQSGDAGRIIPAMRLLHASAGSEAAVAAIDAGAVALAGLRGGTSFTFLASGRDYLGATAAKLAIDWMQRSGNTASRAPLAMASIDDKGSCSSIMLHPCAEGRS